MFDILREAVESVFCNDEMCTNVANAGEYNNDHRQRHYNSSQTKKITLNGMEYKNSSRLNDGRRDTDDTEMTSQSKTCLQNDTVHNLTELNTRVHNLCEQLSSVEMSTEASYVDQPTPCISENNIDLNQLYKQDVDGDTLLHSAIITLNSDIAQLFIDCATTNEVLNLKNKLGQTPLHLSVLTNQVSVLRRLIVGGADIVTRDNGGNTPLHIACRKGYTDMVTTLTEPVRYPETKRNRYDIPYQRIPHDLNIANYDGVTCMHIAALHGHTEIVRFLIDKHGDPNYGERKTGRTVLHIACLGGNLELVKMLIKYRSCNINARAYDGTTPFDLARDRGHSRILYELAVAGAEILNEIDMDEY